MPNRTLPIPGVQSTAAGPEASRPWWRLQAAWGRWRRKIDNRLSILPNGGKGMLGRGMKCIENSFAQHSLARQRWQENWGRKMSETDSYSFAPIFLPAFRPPNSTAREGRDFMALVQDVA